MAPELAGAPRCNAAVIQLAERIPQMANELVLATALAVVAVVVFHKYSSLKTKRSLPPGPPPIFIVGNALQIPQAEPWVWCGSLKQTYGKFNVLRFDGHA